MENIIIRYANRDELEAVNVIREQVNKVHVNGRPDVFRSDGWPLLAPLAYKRFDEEESGVIVALIENEIVGFEVVQYIHKPISPYNNERNFYNIEEFGVDENHRRKGIATALVRFAQKDAKARGFEKIELNMWEFNDTALAFYDSVGFKTYRRYMEIGTEAE